MWRPVKTFFKANLGKLAVILSAYPLWKVLYNIIDAWGNLQMITDYLPRIRQFLNSTAGTLTVMCVGFALAALQLFRQGRRQTSETGGADAEIQQAVYTHAGVMFQRLESEREINFFLTVFNGLPYKIEVDEQAEGFILLEDKALLTRPQFSVSADPLNDRKLSIGLAQRVDEETAAVIKSRLDNGEQLSFSFASLHVYFTAEGKRYRLNLPDGLICRTGVHYANAVYAGRVKL